MKEKSKRREEEEKIKKAQQPGTYFYSESAGTQLRITPSDSQDQFKLILLF